MITWAIVVTSIALAVVFSVAWMLVPDLRAWVERPKHQFHDRLQQYDRDASPRSEG